MNKCENCEMTDEYCASGDCPKEVTRKVGQIYKDTKFNCKFVVTDYVPPYSISVIFDDGEARGDFWLSEFNYDCELIAEYPTWQEAVNSKEFRDEI